MTQEEKAKAYDEALKQAKFYHGNCPSEPERKKLEKMFPVLHESEDERVRKSLIKFLTEIKEISESGRTTWAIRKEDAEMCKSFLAWLEKQKEKLGDISTILLVKKEIERRIETWQKSRKELIAMECNTLADDAAVRIEELYSLISFLGTIRCNTNEKQKEQNPINHNLTTWHRDVVYCAMCDENLDEGLRCNLEGVYKTIKELVDRAPVIREQKPAGATINGEPIPTENKSVDIPLAEWSEEDAQKLVPFSCGHEKGQPAEKQDYSELNDLERAILRGFLAAGVENVPIGIIKDTASECVGFLALTESEPVEWSEEDDSMLNTIIADVKFVQQKCGLGTDEWNVHSEAIRWIKSLSERFNLQPKQEWSEDDERMQKEVEKMIVLFT